jgi:hypothetical protein
VYRDSGNRNLRMLEVSVPPLQRGIDFSVSVKNQGDFVSDSPLIKGVGGILFLESWNLGVLEVYFLYCTLFPPKNQFLVFILHTIDTILTKSYLFFS